MTSDRAEEKQFLRFEDAVTLARSIENFFNSEESNDIILELANKFDLGIRENFRVFVDTIEKNCEECMGCHAGGCILGCFITEPGEPLRVCLWDEAIEAVIGTKLVVHEYGHVAFDQIFTNTLNDSDAFQVSEEFAQYFEDNFTISLENCIGCSTEALSESSINSKQENNALSDSLQNTPIALLEAVIIGVGFALGSAGFALIINQFGASDNLTDNNPITN